MPYINAKVYSDGGHYIAIPKENFPSEQRRRKTPKPKQLEIKKDDSPPTPKEKFETAYTESKKLPKRERKAYIAEQMKNVLPTEEETTAFIAQNTERMNRNAIRRKVRLWRKVNLQRWDYFVTFTYDNALHDEKSFEKKLRNTLKHAVSRNGWKYIGVFERSPEKERLHFHGVFHIPQMIGELIETKDYSTKQHKMQTTFQNTHFLKQFGRNDFEPLGRKEEVTQSVRYLLKYIEKSGEKLIYGGKLPTTFDSDILDKDVICGYGVDDRRYSCDQQTEQSIDGQLRVCEDYAQRNGILILNTYIDRAMTGTNDNRPDFQRMIKDSSRREWNYVLVYKLDRFSRNKYESTIHKRTLKNNGVKVLSAMENIPDTPEGIILESLLEGMNQYYSAELSQKVSRGMRENRLKGLYQGGGVPYGYKVENQRLIIDDMQAETVRFMYSQYSKGVFVKDIIAELTAKGITYKGRPFARNTVYDILRNDKYSGTYTKGEEIVDKMYPPIIDKELFESVRKIVNANKFGKRSVKTIYLLRNKVKCGYCGRPISADTGTARNGEVIHYYKCIGRKVDRNGCTKTVVNKEHLEELVITATIKELSKPQIIDKIVKELVKIQDKQITDNIDLKILTREKAKVENLVSSYGERWDDDIILHVGMSWDDYGREYYESCYGEINSDMDNFFDFYRYGEYIGYDCAHEYSEGIIEIYR